jgi:hypothetical protein
MERVADTKYKTMEELLSTREPEQYQRAVSVGVSAISGIRVGQSPNNFSISYKSTPKNTFSADLQRSSPAHGNIWESQ